MPRNQKSRRVCVEPVNRIFTPQNGNEEFVILNVDELEALRLCDLENLDQDAAAERMGISRGTLQRILYAARKSMAEALSYGKGIHIEGGVYVLAEQVCHCNKICRSCHFHEKTPKTKEMS